METTRSLPRLDDIQSFVRQYLAAYQPYKSYWNYEDGCVLIGCADLYTVTGDPLYRDFVLRYLEKVVTPEGVITACAFHNGCRGNTKGLAALAIGRKAEEVADMLEGIPCQGNTSCPDQLSKAIRAYPA